MAASSESGDEVMSENSTTSSTYHYPGLSVFNIQCDVSAALPNDAYFRLLDDLAHPVKQHDAPHFTSKVGLAKAALLGGAIGSLLTLHLVGLVVGIVNRKLLVVMWCFYYAAIMVYHAMEFGLQALYNPAHTTCDQFLYNHSRAYVYAFLFAWAEFWVEALVAPELKASFGGVVIIGVGLMLVGQAFRSLAMIHAKSNFTHIIQLSKRRTHQLVTKGVFTYIRHPSYFGWFWFVVGSQLVLCNPLAFVAYVVVAWRFFDSRIAFEEITLTRFFPEQYPTYKARTWSGIPFIR